MGTQISAYLRKNKNFIIPSIIVGVCFFFLAYTFMPKIFPNEELIKALSSTFLQAVITAVITYLLLAGQSGAEEVKEKNVKVFEEKTKRYNNFIDTLWSVWEDRKITLEELNVLLKLVGKDIVPYTNEDTIQKILDSLNMIAAHAGKNESTEAEKGEMQSEVFNIIDHLAQELNLGGKITPEIRESLTAIECKILPIIRAKELKEQFINVFYGFMKSKDLPLGNAKYDTLNGNEYICMDINDSPVRLIVGPIVKKNTCDDTLIGFFVDYSAHPEYNACRSAHRCFVKNLLVNFLGDPKEMVDFGREESPVNLINNLKNTDNDKNPASKLALRAVSFYNEWKFNDKTIERIIKECSSNKN